MTQTVTVSYSDEFVLYNGEPIISVVSLTALTVSANRNAIYVGSSFPFVRKYIRTYNLGASEYNWEIDSTFNIELTADIPKTPSGLLLNENDLYITYSNGNNNSKILKVNAANGNAVFSLETGNNLNVIYSVDNAVLTGMVISGSYLYALNTGNENAGSWIDRVALNASSVSTSQFIKNLKFAPIQCAVYDKYICVLESDFGVENQLVEVFNLADGSLAHTLQLNDAKNEKIGLSLAGSLLKLQDAYGISRYTFDLTKITSVATQILDIIPYPLG
jgi:hypothetical protein